MYQYARALLPLLSNSYNLFNIPTRKVSLIVRSQ